MDCSGFREDMLDILYGEADPEVAERYDAHAASCPDCRDELASLRGVREALQTWQAPAKPRPRFWAGWRLPVPQLAAAAAVVLAFGGGLAVSRAELHLRDGEIAVRFGGGADSASEVSQQIARHEAAHRQEIEALKMQLVSNGGVQPVSAPAGGDDAVLRRVQEMIHESEARQAAMLQTSLAQLSQQAEAQRRYDLARISAGLSYLETKTGADVARTNELMSHIMAPTTEAGK